MDSLHLYHYISVGGVFLSLVLLLVIAWKKKKKKAGSPYSLSDSLSKPKQSLVDPLRRLFGRPTQQIQQLIPELEEILLSSDVGVDSTDFLIQALQENKELKTTDDAFYFLKSKIQALLTPQSSFALPDHKPAVVYFVGINGTGKTTTIGKLAHQFQKEGKKVLVVAADTFRAAAVDQLKVWAERSGCGFVGGQTNADPSSVIFDGLQAAKARGVDLVLVDTAGRLHTKKSLMEELKKMVRVCDKEMNRKPDEIFLTIDATTGQNGLNQAETFHEAVELTGLVLTKFDGTAKGGILLSVVRQTGLPLRFVGVGEKIEDLKPFDAKAFVDALFE